MSSGQLVVRAINERKSQFTGERYMQKTDIIVPIALPAIEEPISISEVSEVGRKIKASWLTTTAHILTTAELCDQGFTKWGSRGLPLLLRVAQMNKTTFMKLVVIGRDQRLRRIESMLPPGFSIIYEISQLNTEVFDEAVRAGVVHPHVRRAEIEALRKSSASKNKAPTADELPAVSEMTAGSRYELIVPKEMGANRYAQIKRALASLHRKFGIEVVTIK